MENCKKIDEVEKRIGVEFEAVVGDMIREAIRTKLVASRFKDLVAQAVDKQLNTAVIEDLHAMVKDPYCGVAFWLIGRPR